MLPRTRESFSLLKACFALSLTLGCSVALRAEPLNGKVLIRENFNSKNRSELVKKLRVITGWSSLNFNSTGELQIGSVAQEGSASARDLFRQAISGKRLIVIEEVNNSNDIAFSRVTTAHGRVESNQPRTYLLQIDFADFGCLFGDREAREAFDVGWAVLHELDHVVNDSQDTLTLEEAGECETNVNEMRRELRLPERARYFYTFAPTNKSGLLKSRLVRLPFEVRDTHSKKAKRYWLLWDAEIVGGLRDLKEIATLR